MPDERKQCPATWQSRPERTTFCMLEVGHEGPHEDIDDNWPTALESELAQAKEHVCAVDEGAFNLRRNLLRSENELAQAKAERDAARERSARLEEALRELVSVWDRRSMVASYLDWHQALAAARAALTPSTPKEPT